MFEFGLPKPNRAALKFGVNKVSPYLKFLNYIVCQVQRLEHFLDEIEKKALMQEQM